MTKQQRAVVAIGGNALISEGQLGTIASALYRSSVDLKSLDLPPGAAKAARESIGAAYVVAAQVPNGKDLVTHAAVSWKTVPVVVMSA